MLQKERLLQVADAVERADRFDMRKISHGCGTPACIAGHAIDLMGERQLAEMRTEMGFPGTMAVGTLASMASWPTTRRPRQDGAPQITYDRKAPNRITDLVASGEVHVEQMGNHEIWLRIGEHEFYIRAASRHGPPIELVSVEYHRSNPPADRRGRPA